MWSGCSGSRICRFGRNKTPRPLVTFRYVAGLRIQALADFDFHLAVRFRQPQRDMPAAAVNEIDAGRRFIAADRLVVDPYRGPAVAAGDHAVHGDGLRQRRLACFGGGTEALVALAQRVELRALRRREEQPPQIGGGVGGRRGGDEKREREQQSHDGLPDPCAGSAVIHDSSQVALRLG